MTRRTRLFRDRRGVTAVEFALIAPVMLTMICGALEFGHMMYARAVLEGAVVEAARGAAATLETSETERRQIVETKIRDSMSVFTTAKGKSISITTQVFRDFSTAYPENFTDVNGNGKYDTGEPYTDRNQNGKWDPATPINSVMGGAGDVVSYTVHFPKQILFDFLIADLNIGTVFDLQATTVVRNENMIRKTAL